MNLQYITENWVQILAALWGLEQVLRIISELTPWTWDDNLVKIVSKLLKALFPQRKP